MPKLFSIKKTYSDLIYSGKKRAEFRRQNAHVERNEMCLIYTTAPVKEITGYFVAKEKLRLPLPELWSRTKAISGTTEKEFLSYFKGCDCGTAIVFGRAERFAKGIGLARLRVLFKGFRPPQSYYKVDEGFVGMVEKEVGER